jgi:hypothetical protein
VPWKGISQQLEQLDAQDLAPIPAISAKRLKHYLQIHKTQSGQSVVSLYGASDDSRLTEFNGTQAQKMRLNISREFYAGRWAGQVSVNHERGGKKHFDQSFLAYQFGDWNLRVGSLNQYWGPGQSNSLILSNNARPVPAISFSRSQATRSDGQWLEYLGPWFFTAQLGQLESERTIAGAKMWASRFNFKPIAGLELGLSWSAIWGGSGQPNDLSDWLDVLTLKSACTNLQQDCHAKVGNHLAGFDFKYSQILFNQPFSVYGQRVGEMAGGGYSIANNANILGLSTYLFSSKVYIQTSDTDVTCSSSGFVSSSCFYEHDVYQSGYRRYGRAIGSTFDKDAKVLSVGLSRSFTSGDLFELLLSKVKLDSNLQLSAPEATGFGEKLMRVSGFYQTHYGDWLVKIGANIEHRKRDNSGSDTDSLVYAELKYRLN